MRPVCFIVMPYGRKPTGAPAGKPAAVDFDVLWRKVLKPLIEELGYEPVRADQDLGASIIAEMIERLALSDLVVADLTIPNANVFYEVGVRHAARRDGCVLIAADWATPPFDLASLRRVPYPLPDRSLTGDDVAAIHEALRERVLALRGAATPCHELPGFPQLTADRATSFRKQLAEYAAFEARVDRIRDMPAGAERVTEAETFLQAYQGTRVTPAVAMALVLLARDCVGWDRVLAFVAGLPDELRQLDAVEEQRALALSYTTSHRDAIVALEALVRLRGETPERLGLLGGRWKRLAREAARAGDHAEATRCRAKAIRAYSRGMELDLNEYFCSCNLPGLLLDEGGAENAARAARIAVQVVLACERKRARGEDDGWLDQTLLGAAFHAGDHDAATRLLGELRKQPSIAWFNASTAADLEASLARHPLEVADRLRSVLADFRALAAPAASS